MDQMRKRLAVNDNMLSFRQCVKLTGTVRSADVPVQRTPLVVTLRWLASN